MTRFPDRAMATPRLATVEYFPSWGRELVTTGLLISRSPAMRRRRKPRAL